MQGATEHGGRSIELDNEDADVYQYRGEAYASLGKHDRAIADFDRALALNPCDIHAYAGKALVLSLSNSPD